MNSRIAFLLIGFCAALQSKGQSRFTTLGGLGFDAAYAMAVDSSGNIYIAGDTDSLSLSGSGRRSSRDGFVAKLDSTGSQLLYLTYFGGSGNESTRALAVDASGNAYVAGYTYSIDFVTTAGAISARNAGFEDAFAIKLNSSGMVVYSTLLGSSGSDQALGIAVDTAGSMYVTGQTGGTFPSTSGVVQPLSRGSTDCFIAKLNPNTATLVYSTLLGGSGFDSCRGIAVDTAGNAYITGVTYSSNFPMQAAVQSTFKGSADAFVAKLNPAGTALVYSTFLGGDNYDEANAIAVDSTGAAFVTGNTTSWNFPVSSFAAQTQLPGVYNGFVAKLSSTGGVVMYSTLVGGTDKLTTTAATAIAVDSNGRAVIGGFTNSEKLPVQQPVQSTMAGYVDAFVVVVDPYGSSFLAATYVGGSGDDRAYAIATAAGNKVYLAGYTQSQDFPGAAAGRVGGDTDMAIGQFTYTVAAVTGLVFVPIANCRVVDTRTTSTLTGAFGPPNITRYTNRDFPLTSGSCGLPPTARAYSLTVMAYPRQGALAFLSIWPAGQPFPTVSTLNAFDGRIVSNSALVPAGSGAGGGVTVLTSEDADIVIDVSGYFTDPGVSTGLVFYPLNPCRIADTRGYLTFPTGLGPPFMVSGSTRTFPILNSSCTPSSGAQAYSFNMTVVPRRATLQSLVSWPTGQTKPGVTTQSSVNGQIVATAAIVAAGTAGSIDVGVSNEVDFLFDINGYFGSPGGASGLHFVPITPCRIIDTRLTSAFGSASEPIRTFDILGSGCAVPPTARAYSFNFTALPATTLQFLTAWPTGISRPNASTLNSFNGAVVANAAIVPAGVNGKIDVFVTELTNVIIDINGYFAP